MRFHWPVLILMFVLVGCKPSKPSGVLSESRMVKILVDYHLAQGMAEGNDNETESRYLYVQRSDHIRGPGPVLGSSAAGYVPVHSISVVHAPAVHYIRNVIEVLPRKSHR